MENKVIIKLNSDEEYRQFTEDGFDAKSYATKIIENHAISQHLASLAEGIYLLDGEIHNQVVEHHEDLLSQATGIETLEGVLQMMQTRSQSLLSAIERIKIRVIDPNNKIVARTAQLRRLQETCDILRQIIRVMQLCKKLRSQLLGGLKEITMAAQYLNELDYLSTNGIDLSGIEIIEADRKFVKQARKEVEQQSQKMLQQGMELQNQTHVATALQIFFNLNSLERTIDNILLQMKQNLQDAIKNSLDINNLIAHLDKKSGPGKVSGLSSGNTAAFRAALWMNIEKMADAILSSNSQILNLQKVLLRKKDPVTHILFIDHLKKSNSDMSGNLIEDFWKSTTSILKEEFNNTTENNVFLRQALEGEYPKLLRIFNDLWRRISGLAGMNTIDNVANNQLLNQATDLQYDINKNISENDIADQPRKALRDCFYQFENSYLSKSLSRLFDPINLVFSSNSNFIPSDHDLEGIVKTINSELNVSGFDAKLSLSVSRNVTKTIMLFCTKCEQLLYTGSDACQVIGPANDAQLFNARIVNCLYKFHQIILNILGNLNSFPDDVISIINQALQNIIDLILNAIQPLFLKISQAIEDILFTMHQEDFSQSLPNDAQASKQSTCSLYMKELQKFISRASTTYLSLYDCSDIIISSLKPIACRCLDLFVRHTGLVHPVGETGKLKLGADYSQIEQAISPLCNKLSDLGSSYRLIRAIRPMLFQTPEHIINSSALGDVVPISLVLHLFFSRGHSDFQPPYRFAGWSLNKYNKWLDEHENEKDRLLFIKGSLQSYAQNVTNRGGKEFDYIYPYMMELLQKALH